jgi:FimV-like protein
MSISRTLVILALAAAPATLMAQQSPATAKAGDAPFTFRPTAEKDTLWTIVAETVPIGPHVSVNQAMVAILRQNPNAFVRGNLHVLRKGVALTIPSLAQIRAEDRIKSGAVIEQHLRLLAEGVKARAPLYEIKQLPVVPPVVPAASAPPPPRPPAPAASRPPEHAMAASAPASAVAPRPVPVVPAASVAVPALPPASAVPPAPAASRPPERATAASAPAPPAASVAASAPAVAASTAPAARASEPAPAASAANPGSSGAAYLTYLAAGAALLGVALWAWRRRAGTSAAATDPTSSEQVESSGPRLVQVSTAAVDTARSVDAMKPVLELVRNDAETVPVVVQDVSGQATLNLQVARAYVELRRFDEAFVLLQYVVQHGSPEQQQEAQTLLRGST